ncbi:hypothetical protein AX17_001627 [Amanita inopinata Kibby_2008]|nr:hypothetical protein AX17_001627 [Amanita inopinata Kibby_2008]
MIFILVKSFALIVALVPIALTKPSVVNFGSDLSAEVGTAGAVYFPTNDPKGNYIVAADILRNGSLVVQAAHNTCGVGSHGSVPGPDPLLSQGAIAVSEASHLLAAVNAGSDTVTLFKINNNKPVQLEMIGQPVKSGGNFPVSLAFNKEGNVLCVVNGGKNNGVRCFSVNSHSVTRIPGTDRSLGLNLTTPPTGLDRTISEIIFTEDDKHLVVSVKGSTTSPAPGYAAVWDFNNDGTLSETFQRRIAFYPWSMTVIPGKNALLMTDPAIGYDILAFSGQNATSDATAYPVPGQVALCWSEYSPKTHNFYLVDFTTGLITEIAVDNELQGRIVTRHAVLGNDSGILDLTIASIGKTDYLYVIAANKGAIATLRLDGPGHASLTQSLNLTAAAHDLGIQLDPNYLQGIARFVGK